MSITGYKTLAWVLATCTAVLAGLYVNALDSRQQTRAESEEVRKRIFHAYEVTIAFDMARNVASKGDARRAAESLWEVAVRHAAEGREEYWTPRPLYQLVEYHRERAVRDIIAMLRSKTGEDLGDDPQKWIDKYEK